jgi:hypothetical protein
MEEGCRSLQKSYTFGQWRNRLWNDLFEVSEVAGEAGWDGYGAEQVGPEVYLKAYEFIESLPSGIPLPTITPEADGHIAFEWHTSLRRTLSVSVSPEGNLYFSALLGPDSQYGTETCSGELPKPILDLIFRVCGV